MITVASAELQRRYGQYLDEALRQPIIITRNGRESVVMLSIEEYQRLKRKAHERVLIGD
jgi:prevent-host-death family protein